MQRKWMIKKKETVVTENLYEVDADTADIAQEIVRRDKSNSYKLISNNRSTSLELTVVNK